MLRLLLRVSCCFCRESNTWNRQTNLTALSHHHQWVDTGCLNTSQPAKTHLSTPIPQSRLVILVRGITSSITDVTFHITNAAETGNNTSSSKHKRAGGSLEVCDDAASSADKNLCRPSLSPLTRCGCRGYTFCLHTKA